MPSRALRTLQHSLFPGCGHRSQRSEPSSCTTRSQPVSPSLCAPPEEGEAGDKTQSVPPQAKLLLKGWRGALGGLNCLQCPSQRHPLPQVRTVPGEGQVEGVRRPLPCVPRGVSGPAGWGLMAGTGWVCTATLCRGVHGSPSVLSRRTPCRWPQERPRWETCRGGSQRSGRFRTVTRGVRMTWQMGGQE